MNKCFFIGRTTADSEIRYANNNEQTAITTVSLAVDTGYVDNKKTSFFRLSVFGKRAEAFNKYVPKGTKIAVTCHANQDQWKDHNGNNRSAVNFIVDDWEYAQNKPTGDNSYNPAETTDPASIDDFMNVDDAIGEELPFN